MKVSIITLSFNCLEELKKTVCSVYNQERKDCEYIVVDGGSSDGTIEYLEQEREKFAIGDGNLFRFLSEKDGGVYDAMNKGIRMSKGDYILFMNSGDYFYDKSVMCNIMQYLEHGKDVVYGDTLMRYDWGEIVNRPLEPSESNPMPFIHQSTFVKRQLLEKFPFDKRYRVLADHDFFYKLFLNRCSYQYSPIIISSYNGQHGISAENPYEQHIEYAQIHGLTKQKSWPLKKLYFMIRYGLQMRIKRLIPKSIDNKIVEMRRKRLFNQ